MLIAPVIGGILGMHVLTAGDMVSGHGGLPVGAQQMHPTHGTAGSGVAERMLSEGDAASTHMASMTVSTFGAAVSAATGGGMSHDGMAMCVLFLVVGAVTALVALLAAGPRCGRRDTAGAGGLVVTGVMRRGPPGVGPALSTLCVYRI